MRQSRPQDSTNLSTGEGIGESLENQAIRMGKLNLLVDSPDRLAPSASLRNIEAAHTAARWAGFDVHFIEPDFERCGTAEAALANVPEGRARIAFWIGYIPTAERYQAILDAAAKKGLFLPNSLEQHLRVTEMDLTYPPLVGLTPATAVARDWSDCEIATQELRFPLFVKGAVQSLKAEGWTACVAGNADELRSLWTRLQDSSARSRGKVILRELLPLRHRSRSGLGFPYGREYRLFCYRGAVITKAYYWGGADPFGELRGAELDAVERLAKEALVRLDVPYCTLDIGQDEDERWWIIESADGQFSGMAAQEVTGHWHRLAKLLQAERLHGRS